MTRKTMNSYFERNSTSDYLTGDEQALFIDLQKSYAAVKGSTWERHCSRFQKIIDEHVQKTGNSRLYEDAAGFFELLMKEGLGSKATDSGRETLSGFIESLRVPKREYQVYALEVPEVAIPVLDYKPESRSIKYGIVNVAYIQESSDILKRTSIPIKENPVRHRTSRGHRHGLAAALAVGTLGVLASNCATPYQTQQESYSEPTRALSQTPLEHDVPKGEPTLEELAEMGFIMPNDIPSTTVYQTVEVPVVMVEPSPEVRTPYGDRLKNYVDQTAKSIAGSIGKAHSFGKDSAERTVKAGKTLVDRLKKSIRNTLTKTANNVGSTVATYFDSLENPAQTYLNSLDVAWMPAAEGRELRHQIDVSERDAMLPAVIRDTNGNVSVGAGPTAAIISARGGEYALVSHDALRTLNELQPNDAHVESVVVARYGYSFDQAKESYIGNGDAKAITLTSRAEAEAAQVPYITLDKKIVTSHVPESGNVEVRERWYRFDSARDVEDNNPRTALLRVSPEFLQRLPSDALYDSEETPNRIRELARQGNGIGTYVYEVVKK